MANIKDAFVEFWYPKESHNLKLQDAIPNKPSPRSRTSKEKSCGSIYSKRGHKILESFSALILGFDFAVNS